MQPPEIPENFTGILKLEWGQVVENDVLRLFDFRRCHSVARCLRSELKNPEDNKKRKPRRNRKGKTQQNTNMVDKHSNLDIPCPLCNDEDCFWLCDFCLHPLQYNWKGYFRCDCGLAPPHSFEFWCKNYQKHGDGYAKFEPAQLDDLLKKLRESKDKVILVSFKIILISELLRSSAKLELVNLPGSIQLHTT